MKVLIQNAETEHYLTPGADWTHAPTLAKAFETPPTAFGYAESQIAGPFNIVLYFPHEDLTVSVMEGKGRGTLQSC